MTIFSPRFISDKEQRYLSQEEVSQRDFPYIREQLLLASESNNYEDARREWDLQGILSADDPEFEDRCELCNHTGLKTDFVIVNLINGRTLKVGSQCIKRFLILKGANSLEESKDLFRHREMQLFAAKNLQNLIATVLSDLPPVNAVVRFKKESVKILGTLNNLKIEKPVWDAYVKMLFGTNTPKTEALDRIKKVLFDKVPMKRPKMGTGEKEGHWAGTMKTRKARVEMTLARSESYRDPKEKRD